MDNRSMMTLADGLNSEFDRLVGLQSQSGRINKELYNKYDVKQGLRDANGRGVLTGLTEIAEVIGVIKKDGKAVPCEGLLHYRGYDVYRLLKDVRHERYNFEKATYLLLFGKLPDEQELAGFLNIIASLRELSGSFVRDVIMKAPSENIMNALQKSVLTLYSYDDAPDDISEENVLRQCLQLVAMFPLLAVYSYQAYRYDHG
ncbi:MAG: citrate synthase, partial [Eubacterium sp.]|nr:citrate synthase [Eubacterium sp.]